MAKAQRTKAPSSAINKDQDNALRELAVGLAEACEAIAEGNRLRAESARLHALTALEYLDTAEVARATIAEGESGDGSLHDHPPSAPTT